MSIHPKYSIPFPLDDVVIRQVKEISEVQNPVLSNEWMHISPTEFSMIVENVGSFYVANGSTIEFKPHKNADTASLELYMNGSVYGAILHQRHILPLHGSSFLFNNSGVMFCGDSGAGKSSLTTSFCLDGAGFLTDDVTPILFEDEKPHVWPKTGKIKLWDDSLHQFEKEKKELTKIRPADEKYYFPIDHETIDVCPLNIILVLQLTESEEVIFENVQKVDAFSYLHHEIYRREYLGAMPNTEAAYLQQISFLCNHAEIFRVNRPTSITIKDMQTSVARFLKDF